MNKINRYAWSFSVCLILALSTMAFDNTIEERSAMAHSVHVNSNSNNDHTYNQLVLRAVKSSISKIPNKNVTMALIAPTFTAAAYDNAFYNFYELYSNVHARENVTANLNLLSVHITKDDIQKAEIPMIKMIKNLKYVLPNLHIGLYSDSDVDSGLLSTINQHHRHYDIVVIGHQEYVTQREYDNLKQFVANGGKLIILDGNVFFAQVGYDIYTHTVTLIKGHGWSFNGKSAWKSVNERWGKETSQWVGSNYLCYSCNISFENDPWEYQHHEEQYITNKDDKILMNYNASLIKYPIRTMRPVIATYELNYHQGKVLVLGIYADDILGNRKFFQFFDNVIISRCI